MNGLPVTCVREFLLFFCSCDNFLNYLVQPIIESDAVKGFSAKSSEIGKFESESLDGAIDHALYLINKSNKIFN